MSKDQLSFSQAAQALQKNYRQSQASKLSLIKGTSIVELSVAQ